MLTLSNLAIRRGPRLLLSEVNVALHAGWKVGIVGRNGCGKSSLLACIRGELDTDVGRVQLPTDAHLVSVAQEAPALPDPAIEFVIGGDTRLAAVLAREAAARAAGDHAEVARAHQQLDALGGYDAHARAGQLLHGLGFAAATHSRAVAEFSGGWRVRLNLARALMAPSDLLLLDEPTNHLDLDAVLWLERWLRRYRGMVLVISHDREFLDGVVDHTLFLEQGQARLYAGNYSAFERQRSEQLMQQQAAHEREQAERAHLEDFVRRFRAKATKAKQAQSRLKRLEKLAGVEAVRLDRPFHFHFPVPERLPESMLRLRTAEVGYAAGQAVVRDVDLAVEAGDRIGILGPNGAGKSTLVKSLVGELPLLGGSRVAHKDLGIGYFAQHTVENLRAGESPRDHLAQLAPQASGQQLRDWLGRWQFVGDRALEPVDGFSGGERARLALCLLAWQKPGLLVLDEPTNHLDMDMREALAEALNDYPGALVLVSHDRHLLGLVCDAFWRVAEGAVTAYDGDLEEYAQWLRSHQANDANADAAPVETAPARPNARERRQAAAHAREHTREQRKRLRQTETGLAEVERHLAEIERRLADPAVYAGPTAVLADLGREQGQLRQRKEQLEEDWLMLSETLEAAGA